MKFEIQSFRKENGRITAIYRNCKTGGSFIVQNDNKNCPGKRAADNQMITK